MKQNQPHLVVLKMILFILFGSGRSTSFDMRGIKALSRSGSFPRNIVCICFLCALKLLSSTGLIKSPDNMNERCNSTSLFPPFFPFDLLKSTIIFSHSSPPLHCVAVCSTGVALIKPTERQTGDKVPAHQFSFTSWTGAGPQLAKWRAFKLG